MTLYIVYRASIAYQFARYALSLNYEFLHQGVVHQYKRCLLDALGCAIEAYDAPGRPICEAILQELGAQKRLPYLDLASAQARPNAALVNSFLVRFLDYNDVGGSGHNRDAILSILAISEREKILGWDFLTSLVISYELGAWGIESVMGPSLADRG